MKVIRLFLRRTRATPDDDLVRINVPPGFKWMDGCDEVHISVLLTWHLGEAERLADQWRHIAPVRIGGPALGERSDGFIPGMYLKHGYTITSRGCPNHCWFCDAWRREGTTRELPIMDGWNILDDNLLACSDAHIRAVFTMLSRQSRRPEFTGGLEAARLKPWQAEALRVLRPEQMFFAYDEPDDLEPLHGAGRMLFDAGFKQESHDLRCYVLCGYKGDTLGAAEKRMHEAWDAGFFPMGMLWRDKKTGKRDPAWAKFQRTWVRPIETARELAKGLNR